MPPMREVSATRAMRSPGHVCSARESVRARNARTASSICSCRALRRRASSRSTRASTVSSAAAAGRAAHELPHPRCDRCGHPRPRATCRWCELLPPFVRAARSVCWVPGGTAGAIVHALKYEGWPASRPRDGGAHGAARLAAGRRRASGRASFRSRCRRSATRERGYNQSALLARALASRWHIPVWHDCSCARARRATQTRLTPEDRLRNVVGRVPCAPGAGRGSRAPMSSLVDDVVTTAATLNACAAALCEGGARIISYVTFGRAPARGRPLLTDRSYRRWQFASASTASAASAGRCCAPPSEQGVADIDFVAVNDLTDTKTLAHLFKYDSVHGTYDGDVDGRNGLDHRRRRRDQGLRREGSGGAAVEGPRRRHRARVHGPLHEAPTTRRSTSTAARRRSSSPRRRRARTSPSSWASTTTKYDAAKHHIISNASCTTNCLVPMVKVIRDNFGFRHGSMVTIHSYTNDQNILDLPHKDLRRARAAALSIIPTTTGAAKATSLVIPEVKGKIDGISIRVPTPDVSLTDLTVEVERADDDRGSERRVQAPPPTARSRESSQYTEEELVSCDYIGNPHSCILDAHSTNVIDGTLVKVSGWYDNEWGYASRCVDLLRFIGARVCNGATSRDVSDRLRRRDQAIFRDGRDLRGKRALVRVDLQRAARRQRPASPTTRAFARGAVRRSNACVERGARVVLLSHLGTARKASPEPEVLARSRSPRRLGAKLLTRARQPCAFVEINAIPTSAIEGAPHDARAMASAPAREHALPRRRGKERRAARRARSPSWATCT